MTLLVDFPVRAAAVVLAAVAVPVTAVALAVVVATEVAILPVVVAPVVAVAAAVPPKVFVSPRMCSKYKVLWSTTDIWLLSSFSRTLVMPNLRMGYTCPSHCRYRVHIDLTCSVLELPSQRKNG